MANPKGSVPTWMGVPAVFVATLTGLTVLTPFIDSSWTTDTDAFARGLVGQIDRDHRSVVRIGHTARADGTWPATSNWAALTKICAMPQ